MFYEKLDDEVVRCLLCPHYCYIKEGFTGICLARKNMKGKLYSMIYGNISALALDPMFKKPIHYYKESEMIFSIGSYGCNMNCHFCQNSQIARKKITLNDKCTMLSVEELIKMAENQKKTNGSIGVAFTYNEPTINYEYLYEAAKILKEKNLDVVLITNGNLNEKPLKKILPYINAMNIDLKTYDNSEYKKLGGDLETVKRTIELANKSCHIEVTYLAYPRDIDIKKDVEGVVDFLSKVDKNIPLHINRFFPNYKLQEPATDLNLLYELEEIASKKLKNVKMGNI